ncbi:hypothetical protein [Bacillus taeanensis]|uniref:Lipoprotein n=1 Tax=Bacillus taeanensis TaxID=273032 RepID=A0A366XVG0_9BACI|nr:hypothetical protein [Bacillus taeanensis]RBW68143.1 hypothetical protein DS031_18160 [Bacillus taeanensis]
MKKGLFIILIISSLIGCSVDEKESTNKTYQVGVLGDSKMLFKKSPVEITEVSLEKLKSEAYNFDALVIMKETFADSLSGENAPLYKELSFPVFFIGLQKPLHVFIPHEGNVKEEYPENNNLTAQYIVKENGEIIFGELHGKEEALDEAIISTIKRYQ